VAQGNELGRRNGLGSVEWLRVVLDEAHTIRNSETQQAKVGTGRGGRGAGVEGP
jgi:hypothetical protein